MHLKNGIKMTKGIKKTQLKVKGQRQREREKDIQGKRGCEGRKSKLPYI